MVVFFMFVEYVHTHIFLTLAKLSIFWNILYLQNKYRYITLIILLTNGTFWW